jgi:hypothetical protein
LRFRYSPLRKTPAPVAPPLFQRIAMLGASVTSGFEESEPLGGPKTPQYRFANYIEAAMIGTHEPVTTQATALLFLQAEEIMKNQVTATIAAKPTLVIGVDALFWFCYGAGMTEEQRTARFEAGLRQLERIEAPLVVGDIPDAPGAVGGILGKAELPEPRTIERCNERLKTWAPGRKNVTIFPIARIMAAAAANEEVVLADKTWEKGKSGALIRKDHLHPSRNALAALAIATLDAAARAASPSTPYDSLCRDVETVYAGGIARGTAK